jgi:hypothetical protein
VSDYTLLIPKAYKIFISLLLIISGFKVVNAQGVNEELLTRSAIEVVDSAQNLSIIDSLKFTDPDSSRIMNQITRDLQEDVRFKRLASVRYTLDSSSLLVSRPDSNSLKDLRKPIRRKIEEHEVIPSHLKNLSKLEELDSSYISNKAQQVLESNAPKEIQQIKNKELEEFKDVKAQLDSGNTEMLESKIEDFAKNNLEEAEALEQVEQFNAFKNDFPFQSQEEFQWDKGKIASAAKVGSLLTEQQSKISKATDKVGKLKNKYSHYSLGDDSRELKKRNVPKRRWQLHMNLESSIRPHSVIKAAPGLSFNTTSKHNTGIATSFDYQYHYKDSSYQQFSKQLSVRLFSQYKFYKQLFVQAEYEQPYLNTAAAHEETLLYLKRQSAKVWLGGGFEYKVYKKLRAQTQILYNLSPPKRLEEAASRWAIRINLIY